MLNYVLTSGGTLVVIALILIWAFYHIDKIEKLLSLVYRVLGWFNKKWRYDHIANDIQSKVNGYGNKLDKEVTGILPHAMKIEWVKEARSAQAILQNNNVIVLMDHSVNSSRNIVVSTLTYLGKGLLPQARQYTDKVLMTATDITLAKNIFLTSGENEAITYLFENYFNDETEQSKRVKADCQSLEKINDKGFFIRIFLHQLLVLGNKLFPAIPSDDVRKETRDFVEFLFRVANKERGIDVPGGLSFIGSHLRISIMLVARYDTIAYLGLDAFNRRIKICRDRRIEYLFVCGMGSDNLQLAEFIVKNNEQSGALRVIKSSKYKVATDDRETNATCIACQLSLPDVSRTISNSINAVHRILEEYIDEIRNGDIVVEAISRKPGIKVLVGLRSIDSAIDPISVIKQSEKLPAVKFALGGENIEFIKWVDNIQQTVINSLVELKANNLIDISLDIQQKEAIIQVDSEATLKKVAGINDINLEMAKDITGFNIILVT